MRSIALSTQQRSSVIALLAVAMASAFGLVLINAALHQQYLPLASLYAPIFMTFAWRRRTLAMAIIYTSALFPWDIGGSGVSVNIGIGELHLVMIAALMFMDYVVNRWPIPKSPIFVPVTLYLAVCVISSMHMWRGTWATISLIQMLLYFLVATTVFSYYLPHTQQHLRVLYGLLIGGVFLAGGTLLSGSNYFLGMHKNAIGGALSYAIIVCMELWFASKNPRQRAWLSLAMAIITAGLFFSLSRGAWLCSLTGLAIIILIRGQWGLFVKSFFVLIPIIALGWHLLPAEQRDYATGFDPTRNLNILERLRSIDFARTNFENAPLIGVGVGLRKLFDATNIIWVTLAETGVLGLATFAGIHLTLLIMVVRARRRLTAGDPRVSLLAIGAALVFGKLVHGCVDHYWSRGSLLVVWGGAGMAIAAYYSVLRDARKGAISG